MKTKIQRLGILLFCFFLSSGNEANASKFTASGDFTNHYEAGNASPLFIRSDLDDEHFRATMRYRLGFTYAQHENLSAHVLLQIGACIYGERQLKGSGRVSQWGTDGEITDIRLRLGYLTWVLPDTGFKIRMGYQELGLPAFTGGSAVVGDAANVIYDNRAPGVAFDYQINENINLSGFWTMANNQDGFVYFNKPAPQSLNKSSDTGSLYAAVAKFDYDDYRIHPWFMFADVDKNVNNFGVLPLGLDDDFQGYYMGVSAQYTGLESWKFAFDGIYSISKLEDDTHTQNFDGYFLGAEISYFARNGIPALKAWYSSGDKNVTGFENSAHPLRMQPIGDLGRPSAIISYFMPTTMFYGDQIQDNGFACYRGYNPDGTWGVALELAHFSIVKKFQHTVRVAHIGGSNEIINDAVPASFWYMGTDDRLLEFNFNTYHWVQKNFLSTLELGAIVPHFHDTPHNDTNYRSTLSFMYFF